jgi:hypothetical protein
MIIGLMFVTAIISLGMGSPLMEDDPTVPDPEFTLVKTGINMSIIAFAASYSIVIPGLTALLKNKQGAMRIQVAANLAITGLVLLLGIFVSLALAGSDAPSQTTLAWDGYKAGMAE